MRIDVMDRSLTLKTGMPCEREKTKESWGINELVNERDSHKEKCNKNKMRWYVKQKIEYSEKNMQN